MQDPVAAVEAFLGKGFVIRRRKWWRRLSHLNSAAWCGGLGALRHADWDVHGAVAQALGQFEGRDIRFFRSAWRKWSCHSVTELSQ
jgi:hypothetical protein